MLTSLDWLAGKALRELIASMFSACAGRQIAPLDRRNARGISRCQICFDFDFVYPNV